MADLICWLRREPDDARVRALEEAVTLVMVPMLNPDGAQRFDRLNAQGIDLNRDARMWASPEMRALRDLFHETRPDWCLNLHNQNVRKRVGQSDRLTTIALLAEPVSPDGADTDVTLRAKRLGGLVARAARGIVGEHVARYPSEYSLTSMGEYTQRAGSSTLLIEGGFWPHDPEKQFLRGVAFATLVAALESMATGSWREVPLEAYEALEENDEEVFDLLVRGGMVVVGGLKPYRADLGVNFDSPLELQGGRIEDLGDLADASCRVEIDADGLFIHPGPDAISRDDGQAPRLIPGCAATFALREGPEPTSPLRYCVKQGVVSPVQRPSWARVR
jgi:hypothetical protein